MKKGSHHKPESLAKMRESRTVEKIKCLCKFCDKEFFTHPCYIRKGGGIYCSRECSALHRKGIPRSEEIRSKISAANKQIKNGSNSFSD